MSPAQATVQTAYATWVLTGATIVLAVAAIGAGIFAARTYRAQSAELAIAREEARRLRAPRFTGWVTLNAPGEESCTVSLLLLTAEPLESLRVVLHGADITACPIGFYPGTYGVAPMGPGDLPQGWANEHLRPDATWETLSPGSTATWRADPRQNAREYQSAPTEIHGRAECTGADGVTWTVPVTFTLDGDVQRMLLMPP
jgi:hypothetical protein